MLGTQQGKLSLGPIFGERKSSSGWFTTACDVFEPFTHILLFLSLDIVIYINSSLTTMFHVSLISMIRIH